MNHVLTRLSIPPRLRDEMMLKRGNYPSFDVPNTKEGILFLNRWEDSSAQDRDAMMKQAYATDTPIHQVHLKKDEDEDV